MHGRERYFNLFFIATVLLILLFCIVTELSPAVNRVPLFSDTDVSWSDGWSVTGGDILTLPCAVDMNDGASVTIEKRLPDAMPNDAMLVLRSNYLPVIAELPGERLHVNGTYIDYGPFHLTYAGPASVINLPASGAGQVLKLTLYPLGSKTRSELHEVVFGSRDSVHAYYLDRDWATNLLGEIFIVASIVMLIFSFFLKRHGSASQFMNSFYTALFMLFAALWLLMDLGVNAVRYSQYGTYLFVNLFPYMLIPLPFLLLLRDSTSNRIKVLLEALMIITLNLNLLVVLLCCIGMFDLSVTLTASHVVYTLIIITCITCMLITLRRVNSSSLRILLFGMILMGSSGMLTLINFYVYCTPDNTSYFRYGMIVYGLLLAYLAGRRTVEYMVESRSVSRLKYAATHDELTGLYNQNAFNSAVTALRAERPDEPLAIGSFDIDQFKLVNDAFGREQGDRLLCHVADSMTKVLQQYGNYARMESDKFLVCMPYSETKLRDVMDALAKEVTAYPIDFAVTLSFGWYISNDEPLSPETMVDRSSLARQTVKGSYINHCAFYDEKLRSKILEEQNIINQSDEALEKEQFVLAFQPKFLLDTGECCGAEALVRWKHPEKGMIPPGQFIPVYEKNGLITKLDEYVWRHACATLRRLMERYGECNVCPVAVNVSRVDLYNPNLARTLMDIADDSGVPRRLLALEITESAYSETPYLLERCIPELRAAGFSIHMDDFGSGYSSLNMLKEVDVDLLKIDMRFLAGTEKNGKAFAGASASSSVAATARNVTPIDRTRGILTAIVHMARAMDIGVLAEGVETQVQADMLRELGCNAVQGYLYSPPIFEEQYIALLDDRFAEMGKAQLQRRAD